MSPEDMPSDFWWLPDDVDWRHSEVVLGHQAPLRESDDPLFIPFELASYPSGEGLEDWRALHANKNVHRKLIICAPQRELLGPIVLDVDHAECIRIDGNLAYRTDLSVSLRVTSRALSMLRAQQIEDDDLRVYFSGRKGFHIEIRPAVLGIAGDLHGQMDAAGEWEESFRAGLHLSNDEAVDRFFKKASPSSRYELRPRHSFVRLHDSLNCWYDYQGTECCRRQVRVEPRELETLDMDQLCGLAEGRL